MSHFLADMVSDTVTVKQLIYSQIQNKERHHLVLPKAKLNVNDVIVIESEANQLINAKHPAAAVNIWAMVTTMESLQVNGQKLCVYGFVTLEDLPPKFVNLANAIYRERNQAVEDKKRIAVHMLDLVEQVEQAKGRAAA